MPPFFTTADLTDQLATGIASTAPWGTGSKTKGLDFVPYTLTRFNGGPRLCGLPHPYAYCKLVEAITIHWNEVQTSMLSQSSEIVAKEHKDGRIFIMDYDSQFTRSKTYLNKQASAKFVARADISNFYPSIYTHSIGWAVAGIQAAKSNSNGSIWYNKLDSRVRDCKRQETNGLIIGPGTSSIVSEIILCRIDRILEARGYSFQRFIDDYTCFCMSRADAEAFINELERELGRFSLYLNFRKTSVGPHDGIELPQWIPNLGVSSLGDTPSFFDIKLYLSRALALSEEYPDHSVLRYAIHALSGRNYNRQSGEYLLRMLLALCLRHQHLIGSIQPYLNFGNDSNGNFLYSQELTALAEVAANSARSDAVCWAIQLHSMVKLNVTKDISSKIILSYDPCAIAMLYVNTDAQSKRTITRYVKKSILPRSEAIQRNWFLVHFLLDRGVLKISEVSDATLVYIKKNALRFYKI